VSVRLGGRFAEGLWLMVTHAWRGRCWFLLVLEQEPSDHLRVARTSNLHLRFYNVTCLILNPKPSISTSATRRPRSVVFKVHLTPQASTCSILAERRGAPLINGAANFHAIHRNGMLEFTLRVRCCSGFVFPATTFSWQFGNGLLSIWSYALHAIRCFLP
jgi:hypothetical protein